jgi:hypothetical protein
MGIPVSSALVGCASGPTIDRWRLLDSRTPEMVAPGDLRWSSTRLGIQGEWTSAVPALQRVLHQSEAVRVVWECLVPGGPARVRVGTADLQGQGYAERLSVAGDLAALRIRELRWGHFSGPSNHLLWLVWLGDVPTTLVVRNGEEVSGGEVPRVDVVVADEARLSVAHPRVLRSAALWETLPAPLRVLVPGSLRHVREEKWIARARLEDGAGPGEEGWAIYERVTWP